MPVVGGQGHAGFPSASQFAPFKCPFVPVNLQPGLMSEEPPKETNTKAGFQCGLVNPLKGPHALQ